VRAQATVRDAARLEDPRSLATARSGLELAEARLQRVAEERARLERQAAAAEAERPVLEARAREVSGVLDDVPPPSDTLESLAEWQLRARAAAFAERARLERAREELIGEANQVASALLADPLVGTSIALVRQRLERELR
jgi:hypothetical protein